ncbi:MAG TPA: EF-P lysine aminoacylase EpmA, partial [Alphaproteobacteria bacterium]|nr:EF-P lysine aminoacylase EpmA [Alphaproteobacteria bacterium]
MTALPPWHPSSYARRKPYLDTRLRVMNALRGVFAAEDFVEVETPALQISPGNEVHLHAFKTAFHDPHGGGKSQTLYLHTSPEFAMKKLLVAGVPRLYQMARAFRNGERSSRHHPEFCMLEWYRADATTKEIMRDCTLLVRAAAKAANKTLFSANNMVCNPFQPWEMLSVAGAFQRYAKIDLLATAPDPLKPDAKLLKKEVERAGFRASDSDTWDDLFFRVMGEVIEPVLGKDVPTFLCDYPVSMAALARPKPEDPRLAERFELYICGYEIANAFGELTDPDEQERRFKEDMALK